MHFTQIIVLGLSGFVSAAPTFRARATVPSLTLINQDLQQMSIRLDGLDSTVNSFSGSSWGGISILAAAGILEGQVSTTASDIQEHGALSLADSTTIVATVTTISAKYVKTFGDIQAKAAQIKATGYTGVILPELVRIQQNTNFFFNSLRTEADASLTGQINALQGPVNSTFTSSLAAL